MNIWVDADACPAVVKDILCRAAERSRIVTTFVANQPLRVPASPWLRMLQVARGLDVADGEITQRVGAGDIVITADIPLAAEVIARGGHALDPRGELFTADTIRERLSMRDFLDQLRSSGVETGGPPPFGHADRQRFANRLDRLLAALARPAG